MNRRLGLVALSLAAMLSGCQVLDRLRRGDEPPPSQAEPPAVPTRPAAPEPKSQTDITARTQRAIEHLQEGRAEPALALLDGVLAETPGNTTARRLRAQITEPPEASLGEHFATYHVQHGDSLSALAARYAGDGQLFYALARLNAIAVPRRLEVGQVLRVPARVPEAGAAGELPQAIEPARVPPVEVNTTAATLIDRGRYREAIALLVSAGRGGNLTEQGRGLMMTAGSAAVDAELAEDDVAGARVVLDRIRPWAAQTLIGADELARLEQRLLSRTAYTDGQAALAAGDYAPAHAHFQRAVALDPGFAPAAEAAAEARRRRVAGYHETALRAYREQALDEAILQWRQALAVDPDFKPGQLYLARAQELKRRLQHLDNGDE